MATHKSIITLSGKLDNQVYYTRNGKKLVRKAPEKPQLSENSKKSAAEFGRAGAAASLVKPRLSFVTTPIADNGLYNRLSACFLKVIHSCYTKQHGEREVADGDLALLKGFQLNRHTNSQKVCAAEPVVNINPGTGISFSIPGFRLQDMVTAPPNADTLVIQLCCCACDFSGKTGLVAKTNDLHISLHKPFFPGAILSLPDGATNGKVLLVAINFYFLNRDGLPINDRNHKAGKIIEAVLIREGRIVPFQHLEKKTEPVIKQHENTGVSWVINGEPGDNDMQQ
jgi:hypothetical protein